MKKISLSIGKTTIALLFFLFCLTSVWANGNQESSEGDGKTVTIKMWTHDDLYRQFFEKRIEMMNAANPERTIVLETQIMPNTVTALIPASVAGEELPDLIGVEQGWFPLLMENGIVESLLVDLTDTVGNSYDDFVQGRWTLYTYDGKIYGLESALTASVYYYQPAIFEKYGVEVPVTWEDYFDAGAKLAENGVSIGIMDNDSSGLFSLMFLQRGGQYFNEEGDLILGDGENRKIALEILGMLRKAIDNKSLFIVLGNDFWGSTIPSAFSSGTVAGMVAPDWYNKSCLQPGVESMSGQWKVAPMPVWADGKGYSTSVWGGTGFAIIKSSKVADVVKELLDDSYLSLDGQLDKYNTIGFLPTMYEALDDPAITDQPHEFFGGQKIGSIFADVAKETPPLWQSPKRPYLLQALVDKLPLFIEGQLSADEFIDEVIATTEKDSKI